MFLLKPYTEESDNEVAVPSAQKLTKNKWEGEDEEEDAPVVRLPSNPLVCRLASDSFILPFDLPRYRILSGPPKSDWEASSDEEEKKSVPVTAAAPPKKKGTLKQKLAEKEAQKAAARAAGEDDAYDEDAVLDPREKARRDREKELNADLNNAADLFGAAALGGTSSSFPCHFEYYF